MPETPSSLHQRRAKEQGPRGWPGCPQLGNHLGGGNRAVAPTHPPGRASAGVPGRQAVPLHDACAPRRPASPVGTAGATPTEAVEQRRTQFCRPRSQLLGICCTLGGYNRMLFQRTILCKYTTRVFVILDGHTVHVACLTTFLLGGLRAVSSTPTAPADRSTLALGICSDFCALCFLKRITGCAGAPLYQSPRSSRSRCRKNTLREQCFSTVLYLRVLNLLFLANTNK